MRYVLVVALLVALVALAVPSFAADTVESLKAQVDQLTATLNAVSAQLAEVTARLATVETCMPAPKTSGEGAVKQAEPKCWYDSITWNGYWQARYEARKDSQDDFILRRAYFNILAKPNDRTLGVVTFARVGPGEPNIDLANCFVQYSLDDLWSVTFGQIPTQFGWDVAESSSARLPFDRWVAGEGIPKRTDRPGLSGMFYAGPWDRGVAFTRKQDGDTPLINLSVVNGSFRAGDDNTNKTVEADLKWKQGWGQFGASYVNGKLNHPVTTVEQDREALSLYVHTDPTPVGFQAEWLDGKLFGADIEGWYGQVAYQANPKATPFVRYEEYDPNKDASGDLYHGLHIGVAYKIDPNNELTLQYSDATWGCTDFSEIGLQWQNGF